MSEIQSDIAKTNNINSTFQSALNECENISSPAKDESTTVSGNKDAHAAIDDLLKMNKLVIDVVENASKNVQSVGNEFENTDLFISNEISKN